MRQSRGGQKSNPTTYIRTIPSPLPQASAAVLLSLFPSAETQTSRSHCRVIKA